MGKYTRKAKTTGDVSLMEVSPSSIGVRTRAKTLALQRLQSDAVPPPSSKPPSCYLELRSRRLEKTPIQQNSRKTRPGCGCEESEAREVGEGLSLGLMPGSIEADGFEIQENDLVSWDSGSRSSRESTPCSLIRSADAIPIPASTRKQPFISTRKQTCSVAANRGAFQESPSVPEWEKHFALQEQSQQRLFTEKYNFDIVNEKPLPGRYEWVRVTP